MNEYYRFLGVDENATDEEIEARYNELKKKFEEDRWLDGEAGNEGAQNLTKLETAYAEIKTARLQKEREETGGSAALEEVAALLKENKINEAQAKLDAFNERNAEWHYLQSVVFYKKNWTNESKKQLEIALQMDANNQKYKTAYDKLVAKIKSDSDKNFTSYTSDGSGRRYDDSPRQMGGDTCIDWCCQMAICNMMLNCCCNCR